MRHGFFEVDVGGRDDAGIDGDFLASADTFDGLFLEEAEEFDLEGLGDFADFIEEEGAVAGGFDSAFALEVGAGEGSFFVAEEFAFEEGFGDGTAIDGDEGPVFAVAALVDGAGGHFLAGAAFAEDEDGGIGGGDFADGFKDGPHFRAGADHAFKGIGADELLHLGIFFFELDDVEAAFEEQFKFVDFDGFAEEIVGTGTDGAEGIFFFALTGDDDDFGEVIEGEEVGESGEAFVRAAGVGGEAEVEEDGGRAGGAEGFEGAGAVFGERDFVIVGQRPFHLGSYFLIVINN